jgi:hypothetical protein
MQHLCPLANDIFRYSVVTLQWRCSFVTCSIKMAQCSFWYLMWHLNSYFAISSRPSVTFLLFVLCVFITDSSFLLFVSCLVLCNKEIKKNRMWFHVAWYDICVITAFDWDMCWGRLQRLVIPSFVAEEWCGTHREWVLILKSFGNAVCDVSQLPIAVVQWIPNYAPTKHWYWTTSIKVFSYWNRVMALFPNLNFSY